MRQDVLEEAVQEVFDRERAKLELTGIGSAVLESDLGSFHTAAMLNGDQAAVGDSDAMNIGSKVLESGLPIADRFAMDDPILAPDLVRDLVKERCFL